MKKIFLLLMLCFGTLSAIEPVLLNVIENQEFKRSYINIEINRCTEEHDWCCYGEKLIRSEDGNLSNYAIIFTKDVGQTPKCYFLCNQTKVEFDEVIYDYSTKCYIFRKDWKDKNGDVFYRQDVWMDQSDLGTDKIFEVMYYSTLTKKVLD